MVALNIEQLLEVLKNKGVQADIQKETKQLYFGFQAYDEQFAVFMRCYDESQLLQIVVFLPGQFKEEATGDVARFLHWINQSIDLPGFCMEEGTKTIFYRVMLPALGMNFDEKLLDPFLSAVKGVSETFYPTIKKVGQEGVSFKEATQSIGKTNS